MATISAYTMIPQTDFLALLQHRSEVSEYLAWQATANLFITGLDIQSGALYGRTMRQTWKTINVWRLADQGTTVAEQIALGRLAMTARNLGVTFGRFYGALSGHYVMSMTQDGQSALAQLEAYDPAQQTAPFDVTATWRRVIRAVRWVRS